jgi:hypothetical protein
MEKFYQCCSAVSAIANRAMEFGAEEYEHRANLLTLSPDDVFHDPIK